jgi:gluconate:H+ symporter, GntP family
MSPLWILVCGMAIVISSILLLRLHAFLALLLGALLVAGLTSREQLTASRIATGSVPVVGVDADYLLSVRPSKSRPLIAGSNFLIVDGVLSAKSVEVAVIGPEPDHAYLKQVRIVGELPGEVDLARASLVHATLADQARSEAVISVGDRVAAGLGKTIGHLGIIIALAAIIGECLIKSGAADRIIWSIRRVLGDERAPFAFVVSGFVLCVPMFFDTVFYLLFPLAMTLRRRTGKHWVLYVLCVVAGATMSHSLVPPTPGPLLVIAELNVNMGLMMLGGTIVGLFAATAGFLYACWADKKWDVPPPNEETAASIPEVDPATLPPLWLSLGPILLPVVLIGGAALLKLYPEGATLPLWAQWVRFWGDKNVALGVAAAFSMALLWWVRRGSLKELSKSAQDALASAGVVILIIGAGGAFGAALQQTGIAKELTDMMPASKAALLPLAFLITATIRIAQGSATVAMVTSVSIVAPLVLAGDLGYNPVYVALAIGCGSKPIPWMNDSGFWIISRMTGFSEIQTLRTASAMMSLMGVVGLIVTMLGAWLLPLV